jgi:hypothetical protein
VVRQRCETEVPSFPRKGSVAISSEGLRDDVLAPTPGGLQPLRLRFIALLAEIRSILGSRDRAPPYGLRW